MQYKKLSWLRGPSQQLPQYVLLLSYYPIVLQSDHQNNTQSIRAQVIWKRPSFLASVLAKSHLTISSTQSLVTIF